VFVPLAAVPGADDAVDAGLALDGLVPVVDVEFALALTVPVLDRRRVEGVDGLDDIGGRQVGELPTGLQGRRGLQRPVVPVVVVRGDVARVEGVLVCGQVSRRRLGVVDVSQVVGSAGRPIERDGDTELAPLRREPVGERVVALRDRVFLGALQPAEERPPGVALGRDGVPEVPVPDVGGLGWGLAEGGFVESAGRVVGRLERVAVLAGLDAETVEIDAVRRGSHQRVHRVLVHTGTRDSREKS